MIYYRNLKFETSPDVYEPAEDSHLMAESLRVDDGERVLDMGTGVGIVALIASSNASEVVGVDINPKAVEIARENAKLNGTGNASFKVSDLFSTVVGRFNVIAFNPPYLPVADEGMVERAWSGGKGGVEIIKRFLLSCGSHLKPEGRVYLLVSTLNDSEEVGRLVSGAGFTSKVAGERKVPFETLTVLELTTV
ncbi:MAG: HemK2/MTQ2 family protein methyltransferase [Candidatus Altiarchaeota archaeon]